MHKKYFYSGLIILVILLIAYITLVLQWEKIEIETGLSTKAKENPLLASKLLLAKNNISFVYLSSPKSIFTQGKISLNTSTSLMVDEAALLEYPTLENALLDWVAKGGHLIYILSPQRSALNIDDNSTLLEQLSLQVQSNEDLFYTPQQILSQPKANIFITDNNKTLSLYIPFTYFFDSCAGKSYTLTKYKNVELKKHQENTNDIKNSINNNENKALKEETDIILICDMSYQQGFITFLPSIHTLSTQSLKHLDHGAFLLWLVSKNKDLYYLPSFKTSNWLVKLWQWSWLFIVLIVLIIISFIWYLATRFGSAITPIGENKSLFTDHITAMGNFLYRHDHDQQLKQALILDLEQAIENRNVYYKHLSDDEKAQLISQLTGKELNTIKQLLNQELPKQALARIQYIQLFKALRKAL